MYQEKEAPTQQLELEDMLEEMMNPLLCTWLHVSLAPGLSCCHITEPFPLGRSGHVFQPGFSVRAVQALLLI